MAMVLSAHGALTYAEEPSTNAQVSVMNAPEPAIVEDDPCRELARAHACVRAQCYLERGQTYRATRALDEVGSCPQAELEYASLRQRLLPRLVRLKLQPSQAADVSSWSFDVNGWSGEAKDWDFFFPIGDGTYAVTATHRTGASWSAQLVMAESANSPTELRLLVPQQGPQFSSLSVSAASEIELTSGDQVLTEPLSLGAPTRVQVRLGDQTFDLNLNPEPESQTLHLNLTAATSPSKVTPALAAASEPATSPVSEPIGLVAEPGIEQPEVEPSVVWRWLPTAIGALFTVGAGIGYLIENDEAGDKLKEYNRRCSQTDGGSCDEFRKTLQESEVARGHSDVLAVATITSLAATGTFVYLAVSEEW